MTDKVVVKVSPDDRIILRILNNSGGGSRFTIMNNREACLLCAEIVKAVEKNLEKKR